MILSIQLIDTSKGIKNYFKLKNINIYTDLVEDSFWYEETKNLNKIFSTYPVNYNSNFDKLSYLINENQFKKTTLLKTARVDRKKISEKRYKVNEDFSKKKLDPRTLYIIHDIGHLINLKNIFNNEDVGFFFRDNIWSMIYGKKNKMTNSDVQALNNIENTKLYFNVEEEINFDFRPFLGLGWTHNFNAGGVWSEGKYSYLQFKIDEYEHDDEIYLELECEPFLTKKNPNLNIDIYVNDRFNKNIKFDSPNISESKKIKIKIKIPKNTIKDNLIIIKFINNNLVSPYDLYLSPDSRKLSFLLTKVTLHN